MQKNVSRCVAVLVTMLLSGAPVRAATPGGAAGDQAFLKQALGVNQLELELGRLAIARATAPDVKAMGEKMVKKHSAFGEELGALAKESGVSPKASLTDEQRQIFDHVKSQSGHQFDGTFKSTVDAGHVTELQMYEAEVAQAANPRLRALAERRVGELQSSMMGTGTGSGKQ